MSILHLDNVRFVRNHRVILDGVSWTVRTGEHWAILGANGSGKTTMLKIVTGYEWPSEGSVEVLGEKFGETDVRALRKRIGWVSSSLEHRVPSEDRAIDVVVSGYEASLGLYRQFDEQERNAALTALRSVGGESLERKRYGVLSQGEQQRVLIARALVASPSLLILDEPCAGLDPAARHHLLRDLGYLANSTSAPSLILVTHHIEEIKPWINRVLVVKAGRVLATGSPREILCSDILAEAFSVSCTVSASEGCYTLAIDAL